MMGVDAGEVGCKKKGKGGRGGRESGKGGRMQLSSLCAFSHAFPRCSHHHILIKRTKGQRSQVTCLALHSIGNWIPKGILNTGPGQIYWESECWHHLPVVKSDWKLVM